mgnify:FL=1
MQSESPLLLEIKGENRSIFQGPSYSVSHVGNYNVAEIKSAFQKYFRRCNYQKALYFVLLLFLFPYQSVRTNLINRLIVIVSEDISLGEWWIVKISDLYVEKLRELPIIMKGALDITDLAKLVWYMAKCRKTRLPSHLSNFYGNQSLRQSHPDRLPGPKQDLQYFLKEPMPLEDKYKAFDIVRNSKTPEQLRSFIDSRNIPRKNLRDAVGILVKRYDTIKHREKNLYLQHAILMLLSESEFEWENDAPAIDEEAFVAETKEVLRWIKEEEKVELDEYCIDMHTKRKAERSEEDRNWFRRVGAVVENPHPKFTVEFFKKFYDNGNDDDDESGNEEADFEAGNNKNTFLRNSASKIETFKRKTPTPDPQNAKESAFLISFFKKPKMTQVAGNNNTQISVSENLNANTKVNGSGTNEPATKKTPKDISFYFSKKKETA